MRQPTSAVLIAPGSEETAKGDSVSHAQTAGRTASVNPMPLDRPLRSTFHLMAKAMSKISDIFIPSAQRYAVAFKSVSLTKVHRQILAFHYHAPDRTVTATQVATAIGESNYARANWHYGKLARLMGEELDYAPEPQRLGTLVLFDMRDGEWHWLMRSQVAEALELLGWVKGSDVPLPEEIDTSANMVIEGAVRQISVNAYDRSQTARSRCVEHYGSRCAICGFDFGSVYGEIVEGLIHVHHLRPLSEIRDEYVVDPIEDLRPVCPNCHAVIHRRIPPFSIEEVKEFIEITRAKKQHGAGDDSPSSAPRWLWD